MFILNILVRSAHHVNDLLSVAEHLTCVFPLDDDDDDDDDDYEDDHDDDDDDDQYVTYTRYDMYVNGKLLQPKCKTNMILSYSDIWGKTVK